MSEVVNKTDAVVEEKEKEKEKEKVVTKQPKISAPKAPKTGTVVECVKLNVRKGPFADAEIITEINVGSEVQISEKESTKDFYHVYTPTGADGFCMKKFIKINK